MFFKNKEKKEVVGGLEKISLPKLNVKQLVARVDSGARTSALHAENIKIVKEDGKKYVCFDVMLGEASNFSAVPCKARYKGTHRVVSSNGQFTKRPVIRTTIKIKGQEIKANISLIDRSEMKYRMLIGRDVLMNRFLIDVSHNAHFNR